MEAGAWYQSPWTAHGHLSPASAASSPGSAGGRGPGLRASPHRASQRNADELPRLAYSRRPAACARVRRCRCTRMAAPACPPGTGPAAADRQRCPRRLDLDRPRQQPRRAPPQAPRQESARPVPNSPELVALISAMLSETTYGRVWQQAQRKADRELAGVGSLAGQVSGQGARERRRLAGRGSGSGSAVLAWGLVGGRCGAPGLCRIRGWAGRWIAPDVDGDNAR